MSAADSTLRIYGSARSRAFRVIWLCKESGIDYQHVPLTINMPHAECKQDWYLELNPNARVPTIDDDGFVMWESSAINLYLAEKYGSPLYPPSSEGRGRVLQWALFVANDVEAPMTAVCVNRVGRPAEKCDPAAHRAAEQRLPAKLAILEQQLSRMRYFGGERWDLSDFMVASALYLLFIIDYDFSCFPKLEAWLCESLERPAVKQARKLREIW